jgi:hypothetical protein
VLTVSTPTAVADLRRPVSAQAVFPPPFEAIRPFFEHSTQWGHGGDQTHFAYRTLKDHFPELSSQEVFLIVVAAQRLFGHPLHTH